MTALHEFANYVKASGISSPVPAGAESMLERPAVQMPPLTKAPPKPLLAAIRIEPASATLLIGGQQQFTATGEYADGSTEDISGKVVWSSEPAHIVVIDRKGLATGDPETLEPTTVTISATGTDAHRNTLVAAITVTVTPGDQQKRLREGVNDIDLSKLRADLESTSASVSAALEADKGMRDAVASAKVDIDEPEAALACMKGALSDQDRNNLTTGATQVEQGRIAVVNILHQMQITLDQLQAARERIHPDKLPAQFFDDLDKDLGDVGTTVEHLWDFVNGISSATDWISLIQAVAGSDQVKDHIKALGDEVADLNGKLAQVGETLNNLITALDEEAARAVSDLTVALEKERDDWDQATAVYVKEINNYRALFSTLSGKAGCPPEITKAYMAVVAAGQLSQNARSALITQSLAKNKYQAQVAQLIPLGDLIWNAPASEKSITNNYLVYEKGGQQFGYYETIASLQKMVQQLERVKQLYEAADTLDKRVARWNDALAD